MIKQLTKDLQFSTLGNVYMTEDEQYRLIDVKTLNKLLKQRQSKVMLEDMQKQLDVAIPKLQEANSENKRLREEMSKLRSASIEVEKLQSKVADLQKQLEELKSSATNRMSKAREVKMKKSAQTAAMIISLAVQRYDVETIRQILSDKDIKIATIYRARSVKEDKDRERILNLYAEYPNEFNGVSKEDLIKWFETNRIKKLHLISKEEFISKYGEAVLPEKDKYITEDYYSTKDM